MLIKVDITARERQTETTVPTGHTEKAWGRGQWQCPGATVRAMAATACPLTTPPPHPRMCLT